MAHKLLRKLDEEYRQKRAELIANNYDHIVGDIHDCFQVKIINLFLKIEVKEIVKFDYMTNLETDGDKHIWVDFMDEDGLFNYFKITVNQDIESYCTLNKEKYSLDEIGMKIEEVEDFSDLCLSEFRRGYDKPLK